MEYKIVKKKTHELETFDILVLEKDFYKKNKNIVLTLYGPNFKKYINNNCKKSGTNNFIFEIDDEEREFITDEISNLYTSEHGDIEEDVKPEHTKYTFFHVDNLFNKGFSITINGDVDYEWDVIEQIEEKQENIYDDKQMEDMKSKLQKYHPLA